MSQPKNEKSPRRGSKSRPQRQPQGNSSGQPGATKFDGIKITPLGGLREIGMNVTCYETSKHMIIVDCGLMFPEETQLGVDVVIPDFTYIVANASKVQGLFITHGHEDHIGAIPFLVRQVPKLKIFATRLVAGMIRHRLKERNLENAVTIIEVAAKDRVNVNDFSVEFIAVNHSIADACALAIDTPHGVIIHTGDFKIDYTPVDGRVIDLPSFARYGENGVLALLSDSTNTESVGMSATEGVVRQALDEEIEGCKGKVIVSAFSSNIHRIQTLMDIAKKFGRKIAFDGRSILNNTRIARETGYMHFEDEDIIPIKDTKGIAPQKLMIITTGSQGESLAALPRMANDGHAHVKIKPGDTIIFSSKTIPGNERSVSKLVNQLFLKGARVVYNNRRVHASGHAYQEEQKTMINLVRPKYFIPIHGEYRHLYLHSELAKSMNIPDQNIFILKNGQPLLLNEKEGKVLPEEVNGRVFIDGSSMEGVEEPVLMDRRSLGSQGIAVVHMAISQKDGELVSGPNLVTSGFELSAQTRKEIEDEIKEIFSSTYEEGKTQRLLRIDARRIIRKSMKKKADREPLVLPVITEI
ncbi:ribonuclease J [Desulfurispirillum indicum]|uniref:Ribonuclease J n=1 Tax=Desulfurispirillum indicum (strain ATCC BAA-1389 / DSM 22839 / S5) TaxID=653733 RepID=E6W347_DESIS|nr:ribonuclease J [Desulfurispirillum indicum]ADU65708.1 RNA-metabolising metallo-beta-lactamase [Desulfurispirillum indicum S5]UCZ57457.1 ribonuclease J [Desulfurispirillum indicum]